MQGLTIHQAAETTGWSPRMLRYLERVGLLASPRSAAGYRVYGAADLQRLRSLRALLSQYDIGLSDVAFAKRLAVNSAPAVAVAGWLEAWSIARRSEPVPNSD